MEDENSTFDWRGRPSNPQKHGGMRAAAFVLGLQGFEVMAIAAVASNLITYLINEMHFPLSNAANVVTNFVGTLFLVGLLGGFVADSYIGSFWTTLLFGFVELSGFIVLSVQAHVSRLRPPPCDMIKSAVGCQKAEGLEAAVFFGALYSVALGSGCVKPNMIAHGADQFVPDKQSKQLSSYFNAAYFAFSLGELVALTLLVWLQTHSGMDIGFGVSAAVMGMGLISLVSGSLLYRNKRPRGSILTPLAQVVVAAFLKRRLKCPSDPMLLHGSQKKSSNVTTASDDGSYLLHTDRFRFLDKACIRIDDRNYTKESLWRLCSVTQVEQLKILLSIFPIFACTIVFNTILAQLQTFSVQQGSAMNTKLTKSFSIPPASLQSIPYIFLIFVVLLYDTSFVPMARKFTGIPSGITPLQRIGIGLFTVTLSMISAALMEKKRRDSAVQSNHILSIFWITPQFAIVGLSEMFTSVGLIEFFYKQPLKGMQAFLTAITYCSFSFGFYLSSVLVSLVNKITSSSNGGWLSQNDLNQDRLDLFYWMLAVLSFLNFLNYLFWSSWYSCNTSAVLSVNPQHDEEINQQGLGYAKNSTVDGNTVT